MKIKSPRTPDFLVNAAKGMIPVEILSRLHIQGNEPEERIARALCVPSSIRAARSFARYSMFLEFRIKESRHASFPSFFSTNRFIGLYMDPANLRFTKPPRESVVFAAVTLARSEILIATLMFHSAARPFASIIDVHSIRRNFKGFSCLHRRKGGLARGCKISIVG